MVTSSVALVPCSSLLPVARRPAQEALPPSLPVSSDNGVLGLLTVFVNLDRFLICLDHTRNLWVQDLLPLAQTLRLIGLQPAPVVVVAEFKNKLAQCETIVRQNAAKRSHKRLLLIPVVARVGWLLFHSAKQVVLEGSLANTLQRDFEVVRELSLVMWVPNVWMLVDRRSHVTNARLLLSLLSAIR